MCVFGRIVCHCNCLFLIHDINQSSLVLELQMSSFQLFSCNVFKKHPGFSIIAAQHSARPHSLQMMTFNLQQSLACGKSCELNAAKNRNRQRCYIVFSNLLYHVI